MPLGVGSVVGPVNSVSDGGVFWNTTPAIDDFPLLQLQSDPGILENWTRLCTYLPSPISTSRWFLPPLGPLTTRPVWY